MLERFIENIKNIHKDILGQEIDWVLINTGEEGSGKSATSLYVLKILEQFDLENHVSFNFEQYFRLIKKHKDNPGAVIVLDEAVSSFFSREARKKFNSMLVKLLIINRSFQHFHILNIPNFYYLDIYIREQRAKTLLFNVFDMKSKERFTAFYNRKQIINLIMDKEGYFRKLMLKGVAFVQKYKPKFTFQTPFEELKELWDKYQELKRQFQYNYLDEIEEEIHKAKLEGDIDYIFSYVEKDLEFAKSIYLVEVIRKMRGKDWEDVYNELKTYYTMREIKKRIRLLQNLGLIKWEKKDFVDVRVIDPIYYELRDIVKNQQQKEIEELQKLEEKVEEFVKSESEENLIEELRNKILSQI